MDIIIFSFPSLSFPPFLPPFSFSFPREAVPFALSLAEWLRRWTRNPLGTPRAGSNPADYAACLNANEKWLCLFLLVPSKLFSSLSASDKHAVGHISSRKPVVPCGRIVVSSLHCGCSKPCLNPGQDSILLSGSGNMTLLFATSSYSSILCLKLTGVLCCLPAAKTAGWLQTEVVVQNHGKCNLFHAQKVN